MPAGDIETILKLPIFDEIDPRGFPDDLPLAAILANDARILQPRRGDTIFRQGEYGTSVFFVLRGRLESSMACAAARQSREPDGTGGIWQSILGALPGRRGANGPARQTRLQKSPDHPQPKQGPRNQVPPAPHGSFSAPVLTLRSHAVFGVLGAFTRKPRSGSVVAVDDDTVLLELRWPGVRDMLIWSEPFRDHMEEAYAEWGLWTGLQGCSLFANVDDDTLKRIAHNSSFERYGEFEWSRRYQKKADAGNGRKAIMKHEPIIAEQGHYLDGLLLILSGFVRVTETLGREERTVGYATKNTVFGLTEIAEGAKGEEALLFRNGLRAAGYVDLIRVPTQTVEKHLLPTLPHQHSTLSWGRSETEAPVVLPAERDPDLPRPLTEFFVENRFTNGTMAMAINTDRCVNCDDCVRACAAAHDGSPRFIRHGPTHGNLMVANACMHCLDPVCLIDCPTAAIHRDQTTGTVVINDATCIGCAACAEACPYDNIQMAELRARDGAFLTDEDGVQILRAEKCDLCAGYGGGPACVRVCPHDALMRVDIRDSDTILQWLGPMR